MNERIIQLIKERLDEEKSKLREYTRRQQFDFAIIHSARIDVLYWILKILEKGGDVNE